MSFLSRLTGSKSPRRVMVVGLDGVPHTFLGRAFAQGWMPALGRLAAGGRLARMTTVVPTISSVAWSTYMTGKNPGKHGIHGFVDRKADSYDVFVPTALNLRGPTLWDVVGEAGRKVVVINVPVTYPVRPVNGILIGDFLCTSIDKVAYPASLCPWLREMNYRIDADAKLARTDPPGFRDDVFLALERRFAVATALMEKNPWDFFQLHVMETDRVNHFWWPADGTSFSEDFIAFYRELDARLADFLAKVPSETTILLMSDHGFCPVRREVYLNQFLVDRGYLVLPEGQGVPQLLPESKAYSLIPGRIYVNLQGREPRGSVPLAGYEEVRRRISADLLALLDPETGLPVIARVLPGEEVFAGHPWGGYPPGIPPRAESCPPDLVAVPVDGYDLKGNTGKGLFGRSELTGMHTWDDAFLLAVGKGPALPADPYIADVMPSILRAMDLAVPPGVDGRVFPL